MAGKATAETRGRKASAAPLKHILTSRLNAADYAVFCEIREEEAAPLRVKGIDFTESDFLRVLIYEGAERRGRKMGQGAAAATGGPSNGAGPAEKPKAKRIARKAGARP